MSDPREPMKVKDEEVYQNFYVRDFHEEKRFLEFVSEAREAGHRVRTWTAPDKSHYKAFVYVKEEKK